MKLEEVARLAGVSRTTASYVINGKAEQHRISAADLCLALDILCRHQFIAAVAQDRLHRLRC